MKTKVLTYKNTYSLDELLTLPVYVKSKDGYRMFTAMLDTGAETSAISNRIKNLLDLEVSDSVEIRGVHGVQLCSVITTDISFDSNVWLLERKVSNPIAKARACTPLLTRLSDNQSF